MKIDIGMSEGDRKAVSSGLEKVLADSYTLYLKTQKFHWNVTGHHFHSLHEMFEQQYTDLAAAVDEIAERIRALGFPAPGSQTEFSQLAVIKESIGQVNSNDMVKILAEDHQMVVHTIKSIFPIAEKAADQPTIDLLTQRMRTHEKNAWMLRSTLG